MKMSLTALQTQLVKTLTSREMIDKDNQLLSEVMAGKLTPEARLGVYRHNVFSNLSNALAALYPVIQRIVGEAFFTEATHHFIAAHPSPSGDLNQYGAAFADFLASYPHASELPYLPDVARLEWRWHLAFHAADAEPLALTVFQTIPQDAWGATKFSLAPSVSMLTSAYPLLQIWLVNQPEFNDDWEINWDIVDAYFLIGRQENDVIIRELNAAQFSFLGALRAKATLEHAVDRAVAFDAAFDLQAFLIECVQSQVIVGVELPI